MKNKKTRAILLLLSIHLLVTSLTGCSESNPAPAVISGAETSASDAAESSTEIAKDVSDPLQDYLSSIPQGYEGEPVKLRYFHFWENKGTIDPKSDIVGPVIEKKFNVVFDEIINPTQSPADRLNIMINSGDIPDITVLPFSELSGASKHGMEGLFLNLNSLVEQYPDIKKLYTPYIQRILTAEDGNIYSLPLESYEAPKEFTYNMQGMWIRKKFAEQLQINPETDMKTPDDLFNVLSRMKDEIKDFNGKPIIPYGLGADGWGDTIFYYIYGANWHNLLPDDKTIDFMMENEGAKKGVLFLNKLMTEGLLERDAFIHKDEQFREKLSQGRYGMIMHVPSMVYDDYNPLLQKTDPEDEYIPVPIPIVTQEHKYFQYPENPGSIVVLSSKVKNPERILEMCGWTASDDGYLITGSGIPGKFYTLKDGVAVLTEEGMELKKDAKKQEAVGLRNWYRFAGYKDTWKRLGGITADDPRIAAASKIHYQYKIPDDGTQLYPNPDSVVAPLVPFRNDGWNIVFKIWMDTRPKVAIARTEFEAIEMWDSAVEEMKRQAFDKMREQFERVYNEQLVILEADKNAQAEALRVAELRQSQSN